MRRLILLAVLVWVIALVVVACGDSDELTTELESAEELWETAGIVDYDLMVEYNCFCLPERTGPFDVAVRNGEVVEVRYEGTVIEPQAGTTPVEVFTVEGLFGEIKSSLDADELTVNYGELGNPTLIDIDFITDAVDDELRIVANLTTR